MRHAFVKIGAVLGMAIAALAVQAQVGGVRGVVDRNLQGWQWRVRGQDAQGQFTDWSPWAMFQFSQCRLSDGTPRG